MHHSDTVGSSPTLWASQDPLRHNKCHSFKKVQILHLEHALIALPQFFSYGVERYPPITHIYIIKKIRVFCTNIFGAKILWALLKVRGLLRLTFFPSILKGDPKRYRVTQRDTWWLKGLQGDSVRYRVTQRDTGWLSEIQGDSNGYRMTQWVTGWSKEIQGDSVRYRVTQTVTGWLSVLLGNPKRYRVTQWDTV